MGEAGRPQIHQSSPRPTRAVRVCVQPRLLHQDRCSGRVGGSKLLCVSQNPAPRPSPPCRLGPSSPVIGGLWGRESVRPPPHPGHRVLHLTSCPPDRGSQSKSLTPPSCCFPDDLSTLSYLPHSPHCPPSMPLCALPAPPSINIRPGPTGLLATGLLAAEPRGSDSSIHPHPHRAEPESVSRQDGAVTTSPAECADTGVAFSLSPLG